MTQPSKREHALSLENLNSSQKVVAKKILKGCEKYKIEPPKSWTYNEVKKVGERINDKAYAESWNREVDNMNRPGSVTTDDSYWK